MVGENFDSVQGRSDRLQNEGTDEDGRAFLGVNFTCCHVYARVYINHDRSQYIGHCPRCARRVSFKVGPGGTDERFFTAY
jgi:hypothetical protein